MLFRSACRASYRRQLAMASPVVTAASPRVLEPLRKAHFNVNLSDRLSTDDTSLPAFSGVKYNHKPAQASQSRTSTITARSSGRSYELTISDEEGGKNNTTYRFTGQKSSSKKSYVLVFDPAKQTCTLEPLDSTYTFNLTTKNNSNLTQAYPQLPLRRHEDDPLDEAGASEYDDPDPDNPYDFRHFIKKGDKGKNAGRRENESEVVSSPDYRTGTGSAANTPLLPARRAPTSAASTKPAPAARKRKSPEPAALVSKKPTSTTKKPTPTVRLERKASTRNTTAPKPKASPAKSTTKSTSKSSKAAPKSAEIVHSSDSEGTPPPPPQPQRRRSPSISDEDEDDDAGGLLTIEVPDARPSPKQRPTALASLGLGNTLGLGGLGFKSPSNGPISLHSAANSVEGSPNPRDVTPLRYGRDAQADVIDFGDLGGGDDDEDAEGDEDEDMGYIEDREDDDEDADADADVDDMDIGPPATVAVPTRKMSVSGLGIGIEDEEDEDADFVKQMMEGLQEADESSEESEEE